MKIVISNGEYRFYNKIQIVDKLEPGLYLLKSDMYKQSFLEVAQPFQVPKKLYDVEKSFREMVLRSYHSHSDSTGVLLEGYKGQGKSVTAKLLCMESGLPVIIIPSAPAKGVDFISFLNEIQQPYVLLVDEFEKSFPLYTYDSQGDDAPAYNQTAFLSMMDGALSNKHKKLYILTCNDKIDDKFMNRPSRIRFHKRYQFMPSEQYEMVIKDLLKKPDYMEDLRKHLSPQEATTDLLISIINEINIQDMPYSEFKSVYNHSPRRVRYKLSYKTDKGWEYLGSIGLSSAPTRETNTIDGLYIHNKEALLFVDDEQIVFHADQAHRLMPQKVKDSKHEAGFVYKAEKDEVEHLSLAF